MKANEIKKGKLYLATVNKKSVVVEVLKKVGAVGATAWEVRNITSNRTTTLTVDKFQQEYAEPQETIEVPRIKSEGTIEIPVPPDDRPVHWTDGWRAENEEKERQAKEGEQSLPPTVITPTQTVVHVQPVKPTVSGPVVPTSGFAQYANQQTEQQKKWAYGDGSPHLIIEALAGTGKTTTLVTALKVLKGIPPGISPSPQQKLVWDAVRMSRFHKFCCFVAFNNTIVAELKDRVPPGVDCRTLHSMGFGAVRRAFKLSETNAVSNDRVPNIIAELLNKEIKELRKEMPTVISATIELVKLCKMNLVDPDVHTSQDEDEWVRELGELAHEYDVDLTGLARDPFSGSTMEVDRIVARLIPLVMERCLDVDKDKYIDNNDQIWLPVVMNLPMFQHDILFVDEAQDLNRCQHALIKKAGKRLILCGDPNQAIYGFAGADNDSMNRLQKELEGVDGNGRGCRKLKLTVTRRCAKSVVREARRFVSDFEAHDDNQEGVVKTLKYPIQPMGGYGKGTKLIKDEESYLPHVQPSDFIVCRTVAPLVSQYLKFLKIGKKAAILGKKEMAQAIVSLVTRMKAVTIPELIQRLESWRDEEILKEQAKKNPSESHIGNLRDRYDTILFFTEEAVSVQEVIARIDEAFTIPEGVPYIRLSSIHKAKGLEAERVFYLTPAVYPGRNPSKMRPWQWQQELNLKYVAITRAIKELIYVV